jgi:hypothetical protein
MASATVFIATQKKTKNNQKQQHLKYQKKYSKKTKKAKPSHHKFFCASSTQVQTPVKPSPSLGKRTAKEPQDTSKTIAVRNIFFDQIAPPKQFVKK